MRTILAACRERTLARRSWHRVLLAQPGPARTPAGAPSQGPSAQARASLRSAA
jgi:hypothetical protein